MSLEIPRAPSSLPLPILDSRTISPTPATIAATVGLMRPPATSPSGSQLTSTSLTGPSSTVDDPQAFSTDSTSNLGLDTEDTHRENGLAEVDSAIIEALRGKERLFVLRVGELMEGLISERKPRVEVSPSSTYQRLLVYRCTAYYKVTLEHDGKAYYLHAAPESKVPMRRISDLVPAESTTQPAFQIMRRTPQERMRSTPQSRTSSVTGDDPDMSDIEPSEAGSQGGRSNAPGSAKKHLTLEQREALYNEARSRIFMDKAKEKENDMSASSSTFSAVSGSASTSGGGSSSAGDLDDSISSAATESEWSGPAGRDKKDIRRGGSGANSAGSSSRSLRSSAHPNSSRNSRAASPTISYASLYNEPPAPHVPYDTPQASPQAPQGYIPPYMYYQPHPNQAAGQPYYAPYFFPPYPYAHPQHPLPSSDPSSPGEGIYLPTHQPPQPVPYMSAYGWQPAPGPQGAATAPSPPHGVSYGPYAPSPAYPPYAIPYYQPPAPQAHAPHIQSPMQAPGQSMYPLEAPQMNGGGLQNNSNGSSGPFRVPPRNATSGNGGQGANGQGRRGPQPRPRGAWSYGPGVGNGGHSYGTAGNLGGLGSGPSMSHNGGMRVGPGAGLGENNGPVGPRLHSVRRTSGNSSGSAGHRTPAGTGDEASSTASSTSSSSRRTFTSTTSSQHPLPARPDWAVGLVAQPSLRPPYNHDHGHGNNSHAHSQAHNMSLPVQQTGSTRAPHHGASAPVALQPADFPPLGGAGAAEKRAAVAVPCGAWNNGSSARSIVPPNGQTSYSSALTNSTGGATGGTTVIAGGAAAAPVASGSRLDEPDKTYERPPPKNVELFDPNEETASAGKDVPVEAITKKLGGLEVEDGSEGKGGRS